MPAYAVELQAVFLKRVFNVGGTAKLRAIGAVPLQHVIARLRACGTGFFGELQKAIESLAAVLGAFNTAVVDRFSHNIQRGLGGGKIAGNAVDGNPFW